MVVLPPEAFNGAIYINALGITASVVVLAIDFARSRKEQRAAT
jgi:hypothetical protein